jgi:hypothetical protein
LDVISSGYNLIFNYLNMDITPTDSLDNCEQLYRLRTLWKICFSCLANSATKGMSKLFSIILFFIVALLVLARHETLRGLAQNLQ